MPVVSFDNISDLVTAILSISFQYPICWGRKNDKDKCESLTLQCFLFQQSKFKPALSYMYVLHLPLQDHYSLIPLRSLSS